MPRLRALGFEVSQISGVTGGEWSRAEVETVVADYLDMLTRELTGQTYNKAAHRRSLGAALPARSEGAIEFKHANISAVMLELGFPYLKGYKPRAHFQRQILIDVVSQRLASHRMLDEAALAAVQRPVECADILDFRKVRAEAPKRELAAREQSPDAFRAVKRDYLEREALNRSLGMAGEEFAFRFEQWRLIELGAGQLAGQVQHVSRSQGDGLGYDILSFEHDGRQRFIEVKTTTFGERTPFFVSANELRFAQGHADDFHLYRLFDFRTSPRLFELNGPIERHCALDPTTYRASFG